MSLTKEGIIIENTRLYNQCISIIALNAPSIIEEMTPEELYKIALGEGNGSDITIAELKEIYPEQKITI